MRAVERALIEGNNGWFHVAEDGLKVLKVRNGKTDGDDIPPGPVEKLSSRQSRTCWTPCTNACWSGEGQMTSVELHAIADEFGKDKLASVLRWNVRTPDGKIAGEQ